MPSLLTWLKDRNLIHDVSHFEELERLLEVERLTFYCGFDPTAESLHVGSMLPLLMMRRLQQRGHKPIILLGSATGIIGDPSGKSQERKLLDEGTVRRNMAGIEKQVRLFLSSEGENAFELVENGSWIGPMGVLEYLRDVGKHFSVNAMMAKESVRARLENREQGISYTEFSYMLLQAYDYFWLSENKGCRLQIGGSDQWGNITAGIEYTRRRNASDENKQTDNPSAETKPALYGLTFPLLRTSSGTKFGKTEQGTIWLDAERTSPYRFYQFWLNTPDADVISYLELFTDLERDELRTLAAELKERPEARTGQKKLAEILTELVHGRTELDRATAASAVLFGGALESLDAKTLLDIFSEVPSFNLSADELSAGISLADLLVKAGLAQSKGAAKRLVDGGGVYLNNKRAGDPALSVTESRLLPGGLVVLRSGKKNYAVGRAV